MDDIDKLIKATRKGKIMRNNNIPVVVNYDLYTKARNIMYSRGNNRTTIDKRVIFMIRKTEENGLIYDLLYMTRQLPFEPTEYTILNKI
tara:strand:- start:1086 stop:1352 length:267 start_codon:yes stop_codon:yes gene_type:complete